MKKENKKPWGGRFKAQLSKAAEEFTSSISYDIRLSRVDLVQSMAYARALRKAEVLKDAECKKIIRGLETILKGIEDGKVKLKSELEDVHMNIESLLIERVGDVGKKLHTGRSRNDQVATDVRMYLKYEIKETLVLIRRFQEVLLEMAEENIAIIMPGYTHMQKAQPVLFSHHLMAYFEMFQRDKERLNQAYSRTDVLPLGSGSLSGTNFNLDRDYLARELGFSKVSQNSLDAVSDRDFMLDYLAAAAIASMHLSRFAEEIVLWSTSEFDFIELSDAYSTGSSLMPQKKNPDVAELVRGKSGRVYGSLITLLTIMKAQPLAYNRDMQEDKEALFDTVDTLKNCLDIFRDMLRSSKINREVMEKSAHKGFLTATDLAYYLVRQNVPFRQAHEIVGKVVAYCESSNMELEYMSLKQLKEFSDKFGYDVQRILTAESAVTSKNIVGGTSPKRVKEAIAHARTNLLHDKA